MLTAVNLSRSQTCVIDREGASALITETRLGCPLVASV